MLQLRQPPVVVALVLSLILGTAALIAADTADATGDQSGLEFLQNSPGELICEPGQPSTDGRAVPQICTHGNDIMPDLGARRNAGTPAVARLGGEATPGIECYGNGTSGPRVQAVYARMATSPDTYSSTVGQIETYAATMEAEVSASAAITGGIRHIRWVTNAVAGGCELDVKNVVLVETPSLDPAMSFRDMITSMQRQGLAEPGRAYMIWMDHNPSRYCGIGTVYPDDDPSADNRNYFGPSWSRVDPVCWGTAETHELGHNLGAVQDSAPNSNGSGHCLDDNDLMCYNDGSGAPVIKCPNQVLERRWDCNNDDYFNTNPAPGSYLDTHWNIADSPFLADVDSTNAAGAGAFHPVTPVRAYDSRNVGNAGRVFSGQSPSVVKLTGIGEVPGSGVAAVAINLTVTDPLGPGYLTVFNYDSTTIPTVSNINFATGDTKANSAVVTVPYDGLVKVIAGGGSPHVIFDVVGWYADDSAYSDTPGGYHPLSPARILDTRDDQNPVGPGETRNLVVAGQVGVPQTGAVAVVLNVVTASSTNDSYLTVWPADEPMPLASSLNHRANQVVPNQVIAKLGANGAVSIFNAFGQNHLVVDVAGWYDAGGDDPGAVFHPIDPTRVLDTRQTTGPISAASTYTLPFVGVEGIPVGAVAVAANVTVTQTAAADYMTAWPAGTEQPTTSILNWTAGQTVANFSTLTVGSAGASNFFTPGGSYQLIVDVAGWFEAPPS